MPTDTIVTQNKLRSIEIDMRVNHLDREDEIRGLMLAAIAKEHILFLGPPGLNKTRLAVDFASYFQDSEFFYWLMGAFTSPDEVFGPLSLAAYKDEVVKRIPNKKLPTAHFAMLDEIYKASSAINNSLLHIMEERKFDNGGVDADVPLQTIIAGSNELPADDDKLRALHDRFSLRYDTHYINDDAIFDKLLDLFIDRRNNQGAQVSTVQHASEPITLEELSEAQDATARLTFHDDTKVSMRALWLAGQGNEDGIVISDRRWGKLVSIMQADAYLEGNPEVMPENMLIAQHMLWNEPIEKNSVRKMVEGCVDPGLSQAREVEDAAIAIQQEYRAARTHLTPGDVAQFMVTLKEHKSMLQTLKRTSSVMIVENRVNEIFDELSKALRG